MQANPPILSQSDSNCKEVEQDSGPPASHSSQFDGIHPRIAARIVLVHQSGEPTVTLPISLPLPVSLHGQIARDIAI